MGNGASCADRSATPLNEKLRTMLILRAYNCRPRDWTMKDQFEAAAENGILTKDHLRKALRLSECPQIEALLDRCCLIDHPVAQGKLEKISSRDVSDSDSVRSATGSISVASLMSFVEDGRKQAPTSTPGERKNEEQEQPQERPQHLPQQLQQFPFSITSADKTSRKQKRHEAPLLPSPPSPLTTSSTPESLVKSSMEPLNNDARSHGTADLSTPPSSPTAALGCVQATTTHAPLPRGDSSHEMTASVNDNERESAMSHASIAGEGASNSIGGDILSPRVVPLTSKWALSPSTTSANAKKPREATHTVTSTVNTQMRPGGRRANFCGQNNPHSLHTARASSGGERTADELREDDELEDRREILPVKHEESRGRGGGHCTTLVKHLGAVLGLRGKEAYRRLGPGLPVWRKRETLIQERIVQYTTLDEDGKVQELLETEKSQTEVLHMECKRTGEFAHSESTHYESGEAFNGEVVLEETGVERYVHLRSVDDEYEHLESTLPSRARTGGAAGGVGGSPAAEEVESGPGADKTRGHPDANAHEVRDDDAGDGDGDRDGDGGSRNGIKPSAAKRCECDTDDGPNKSDVAQGGTFRQNQRRKHHDPDGSEDQAESSPAAFVPHEENAEAVDCPADASRGASRCEDRSRSTRAGRSAADVDAAAEHYPLPSSPLPYHYRSPSCSPRLSPRPARSPYRQEGVGERVSTGRGEAKQGQPREGSASKDNGLSSRGDVGGPGGSGSSPLEVAGEEHHAGESSHAEGTRAREESAIGGLYSKSFGHEQEVGGITPDAQVPLSSSFSTCRASPSEPPLPSAGSCGLRDTSDLAGGIGQVDDYLRSEIWRENQGSSRHPENGSSCTNPRRQSGADVHEEQTFEANGDGRVGDDGGGSIDCGGFGNGCGGSVIFLDDQVGQGEGVQREDNFCDEESWWQPESGSVWGGLDFLSQKDISSAVCATSEKEMGNREQAEVAPDSDQRSLDEASPRPCSEGRLPESAESTKCDDGIEERVHVSRLIEGLRTSGAPVPVASPLQKEEEECHYSEAPLGQTTGSDPDQGGSHGSSAAGPASFPSSVLNRMEQEQQSH